MIIKNVCVLGGSGFVGTYVVSQLVEKGYKVRVLTRKRERSKDLIVLPTVEVVEADIHDERVLNKQFEGMDAVINLVGILHERGCHNSRVDKPQARRGDFHATHVELPRKIVHACAINQVPRLLHMSALGAEPTADSGYLRSKGIGEHLVREAGLPDSKHENWYLNGPKFIRGQGMAVTIFRPSVIFGRGDSFVSKFAGLIKSFPILPLAGAGAKFQPVFVEDVANAFTSSLTNLETFGKTYELCGPKVYTLQEIMELVMTITGKKRSIMPLCPRLSYVQAAILEHLPGKLLTRDNLLSMKVDNVCGCDYPAVFGGKPAAMEAVVPSYLGGENPRERYMDLRENAGR